MVTFTDNFFSIPQYHKDSIANALMELHPNADRVTDQIVDVRNSPALKHPHNDVNAADEDSPPNINTKYHKHWEPIPHNHSTANSYSLACTNAVTIEVKNAAKNPFELLDIQSNEIHNNLSASNTDTDIDYHSSAAANHHKNTKPFA